MCGPALIGCLPGGAARRGAIAGPDGRRRFGAAAAGAGSTCRPFLRRSLCANEGHTQLLATLACGMRQGPPESPLVYAALIEELRTLAEAHLAATEMRAWMWLPSQEDIAGDVDRTRKHRHSVDGHPVFYKFADDASIVGESPQTSSHLCRVVSHEFQSAELSLKSEQREAFDPQ